MRTSRATVLLLLSGGCALFACYVAVTGGVDFRLAGIPLSSRSWERPALLAVFFGIAGVAGLRDRIAGWAPAIVAQAGRGLPVLVAAAACAAGLVSFAYGTYAAGGSDSSGYLSQAQLLSRGRLVDQHPVHPEFTWPDVPATLAPLGYVPGRADGLLSPSYPPGLPLLMAPLAAIDPRAVFLVVPLSAIAAVWLCWRLGAALGESAAGGFAACLLASSPTFLYHAIQPMSDVPVTVCWTAALLLGRRPERWGSAAAGLAASLAVLIRPNLAPLVLFVVASSATAGAGGGAARGLVCALSFVPGLATLGAIQAVRYGSPLASGYGAFDYLFSPGNVLPNIDRYSGWLTSTHTPFIWVWLFAPLWLRGAGPRVRRLGWICWGFSIAVIAAYLPYAVFNPEEWFYTRFLLPAFPAMVVLGFAVTLAVTRRFVRHPELLVALLAAGLVVFGVVRAASAGVFELAAAERRYPAVAAFVRDGLPTDAFVLADQHSGSIRYYAGRPILRWQLLHPASLGDAVDALRRAGYTPFVVLDAHEEPAFRERFGPSSGPALERLLPLATIENTRLYTFR
jgi:hypothetical protein